ncbi:MAG TPA: hypothetical protein VGI46_21185 [Candidatus Acidoferrum sp.]
MTLRQLSRVALVAILCLALSTTATADSLQKAADTGLALVIVGVVAIAVVVVVVVRKSTAKRSITGCVAPAETGMILTDEKDKRVYILSGDTTGVKPGERMTLQGKKFSANANHTLTWETKKIHKDFGVCQP